ncbi:hypothetical protein LZ30DRAFT_345499 [Colletotrichum cereale]|nr:hypothetical protein LZ30DRAFT_345499 [Colletotrichum cereale]
MIQVLGCPRPHPGPRPPAHPLLLLLRGTYLSVVPGLVNCYCPPVPGFSALPFQLPSLPYEERERVREGKRVYSIQSPRSTLSWPIPSYPLPPSPPFSIWLCLSLKQVVFLCLFAATHPHPRPPLPPVLRPLSCVSINQSTSHPSLPHPSTFFLASPSIPLPPSLLPFPFTPLARSLLLTPLLNRQRLRQVVLDILSPSVKNPTRRRRFLDSQLAPLRVVEGVFFFSRADSAVPICALDRFDDPLEVPPTNASFLMNSTSGTALITQDVADH